MASITCDFTGCVYNASTVCSRPHVYISEGYCMDSKDSGNTGEIIEEESDELVYPEGIED